MSKSVFIIGCGYVGRRVAAEWLGRGVKVAALSHSEAHLAELRGFGVDPYPGDLDQPETLIDLPLEGALLYHFAPPPRQGECDPRVDNLLQAVGSQRPARIVYLGTTGVYGDCKGAWVDEGQPLRPTTDRAKRRVAAEASYSRWCEERGVELVRLRVAGIYGPGRLPEMRLRRGDPVLVECESPFSNRVHIDDLVATAVAAGERSDASGIYNVSDGHPTTMSDYFNRVADRLGIEHPPQMTLTEAGDALSEGMRSYLAESRRLDNSRMRALLGGELRYPDLEQGLAAC